MPGGVQCSALKTRCLHGDLGVQVAGSETPAPGRASKSSKKTVVSYYLSRERLAALRSRGHNAGMGYAILRIAKRKTGSSAAAMSRHALREDAVPNAIAGAPKPEVLAGATTTPELMQKLHAGIKLAKEKGGAQGYTKASTPVLDILVTTSADDAARMGKAGQDDYFKRALAFIAERFGGMANVLTAAIHRDETTPHMQILVMPLDRTTHRFAASKMIGGPQGLSKLQDAFHDACGKPHRLLRGEKGSKAQHLPVKKLYAAMNKGAEVPKFVPVPPAPGMLDRLQPGYAAKKKANEDALARNAEIRKRLSKQAETGRMMHPTMIARQAEKYRESVRLDGLAKASVEAAAAAKKASEDHHRAALHQEGEARQLLKSALQVEDRAELAKLLDKSSKHWSREYVGTLAKGLGIELVAGKPVLDQIRRAGKASTMMQAFQAVERLDPSAVAQVQRMAQTPTHTAPKPRG